MTVNAPPAPPPGRRIFGPAPLAFLVFIVALAALAPGFTQPGHVYFDETWYVPTAREWLASGDMLHPEHPPLAKMRIAAGLKLFGDNPLDWRIMPLVFGALTIAGVYLWTLALTADAGLGLFGAAITLIDGVVFVQSRIAMLDIFLIAFCVFALAAFTKAENAGSRREATQWHLAAGCSLGLAAACKWSGWFLLFGLVALKLVVALMRVWRVRFEGPRATDFYDPEGPAIGVLGGLSAYLLVPFTAYFLCYLPQLIRAHSLYEFIATHKTMIAIMTGTSSDHPYKSMWWSWPAMWRPVWYLFDTHAKEAGGWSETAKAAAVDGFPNPVVLFLGEAAILWALFNGVIRRVRASLIVVIAFFAEWLPWALNPKGLEFYYYFYPSIVALGPALALVAAALKRPWRAAFAWSTLAAGLTMFVYFLPILVAGIGVGPAAFSARVWIESWR